MQASRRIVRTFATAHPQESLIKESAELIEKTKSMLKNATPHGDPGLWKKISIFVAVPMISLSAFNCYLLSQKEDHHTRPEFVPYEHLRIMNRRFPFRDGKRSLFHNPHNNALAEGYVE